MKIKKRKETQQKIKMNFDKFMDEIVVVEEHKSKLDGVDLLLEQNEIDTPQMKYKKKYSEKPQNRILVEKNEKL